MLGRCGGGIGERPFGKKISRTVLSTRLAQRGCQQGRLLRSTGFGGCTFVNKYGAVLYAPGGSYSGGSVPMHWATQLFQNGELWSVSDSMMIREHSGRPAWWPMSLIPAIVFVQALALHLGVCV
jgi:hypothetical protein